MTEPPPHGTAAPRTDLAWIGGAFGLAGCAVGLLLFLAGCFGYAAAFDFAAVPVSFGGIGIVFTSIGAVRRRATTPLDSHVIAAGFVASLSLLGGLLELGVWLHWPLLTGVK